MLAVNDGDGDVSSSVDDAGSRTGDEGSGELCRLSMSGESEGPYIVLLVGESI